MATENNHTASSDGGNVVRSCACCGARINDRFLLHMADRYWHTNCLRCSCCHVTLEDSNSCFVKYGMIFCRSDYLRWVTIKQTSTNLHCKAYLSTNKRLLGVCSSSLRPFAMRYSSCAQFIYTQWNSQILFFTVNDHHFSSIKKAKLHVLTFGTVHQDWNFELYS